MSDRPFFDDLDQRAAKAYVERIFAPGAFDPAIGSEGPRDDVALASVSSARDYMRRSEGTQSSNGKAFRIYPAIANTMSPNAFAGTSGDLLITGLHAGLYAMMFEIAGFVMAQQCAFPEIGDPAQELSPSFPGNTLPAYWLIDETVRHGENFDRELGDKLLPRCPERYQFTIYLTIILSRFVWFHELFHCLNGHVDYLTQFDHSIRLCEVADSQAINLIELQQYSLPLPAERFLQALEFDADRAALFAGYRIQIENEENIIGIATFARHTRCKMTLFCAYLMTFLFEQIAARAEIKKSGSHPLGHVRLSDMLRTTATHLKPLDPNAIKIIDQVRLEFKKLRSSLPQLPDLEDQHQDDGDLSVQKELNDRETDLEVAKKQFQDFAYR